jgi:hypothetical protein
MKNTSRGFINGLLVIIFIALLGGGAYYYLNYVQKSSYHNGIDSKIDYIAISWPQSNVTRAIVGTQYTLIWKSEGVKNINISLLFGTNHDYGPINASPLDATAGTYVWTVPDVSNYASGYGSAYKLRINDVDSSVSSESDPFSITR